MSGSRPPVGPSLRIEVLCDLAAVPAARDEIVRSAIRWAFEGFDDLGLVVTELVTNAIVHGRSVSVITCRMLAPGYLEVAVLDNGPGTPRIGFADAEQTSGRGLRIVDALSTSWGVEHHPDGGKSVWARLGHPL